MKLSTEDKEVLSKILDDSSKEVEFFFAVSRSAEDNEIIINKKDNLKCHISFLNWLINIGATRQESEYHYVVDTDLLQRYVNKEEKL